MINFVHVLSNKDIAKKAIGLYLKNKEYLIWDEHPQSDEDIMESLFESTFKNPWALACMDDSEFLGVIVLSDFRGFKEFIFSLEATIIFDNPKLSKHVAGQLINDLFTKFKVQKIYAKIGANNPKAMNFVEKLGFELDGVTRNARRSKGAWFSEFVYSITNKDTHNGQKK